MIDAHSAGTADALPIGELLVAQGLLSREQLASALAQHMQTGRPLGEVLVALGFVTGEHIAQALATQQGGAATSEYGIAVAFGVATPGPTVVAPPPLTAHVEPELPAAVIPDVTPVAAQPQPAVAEVAPAPVAETYVEMTVPEHAVVQEPAAPAYEQPVVEQPMVAEAVVAAPAHDPETDTLRAEVASVAAERDALHAELQSAYQQLQEQTEAGADAANLRVQVAELRGMADQVGSLQAAAADAEARAAAAEQQFATVLADRDALQEQLATVLADRDALQQHLHDTEQVAKAAQEAVAALQAERDALQQQLHETAQAAEQLHAEREHAQQGELGNRLSTLESRLDQAVDLLGALDRNRTSIEALERRLAAAEAINTAAKNTIATLESQLGERTYAYDELLERLHEPRATTPDRERDEAGPHAILANVGGRYDLLEADGPVPQPGDTVELDGTTHTVLRIGRMPGDDRPTVYTTPD